MDYHGIFGRRFCSRLGTVNQAHTLTHAPNRPIGTHGHTRRAIDDIFLTSFFLAFQLSSSGTLLPRSSDETWTLG